jgi:DNA adenine methylase
MSLMHEIQPKNLTNLEPNLYKWSSLNRQYMLEPLQAVPRKKETRPFVKWAGGKAQLLEAFERFFPANFGVYHEPFLGGGAVFFHLVNRRARFEAILSDTNAELINAYRVIKGQVDDVITLLENHRAEYRADPRNYFYSVRASEPEPKVERAARLIFLNKTCFNGLYRVNKKGEFNVPCGWYLDPSIFDEENLRSVSTALGWSDTKLRVADFEEATKDAKKGDFVYFDPPYHPLSKTSSFTGYTREDFTEKDQERLATKFRELDRKGCLVMLSNSYTPRVFDLYEGFEIQTVHATRMINCKAEGRGKIKELIVRNYGDK